MSFLLLLLMIIIITISILIIIIIMIIIDVCTGLSDYQPWIIYICIHTYIHTYIHIYIHTDRTIIMTNIHLHARPTWNCLQASSPPSGPRGPCWTPVLWDIIFVNWKIDVEWSVYYGNTREHQFLKVDNAPLLLNSISVSPFCQWENVGTSLSNRCLNGWIVRGKHLGKFRATGGSWNGLFLIREWSSGFGG